MSKKLIKIFIVKIVLACFFCVNSVTNAYDLPKVIINETSKENESESKEIQNQKSQEVPVTDKNYIFIGSYKSLSYYLDCYSIKIKKNNSTVRSWSQFIFPIGANIMPSNSRSKAQKFYFDGKNAYNSNHNKNKINDIQSEEDREFMFKCFKVGYEAAFKELPNI